MFTKKFYTSSVLIVVAVSTVFFAHSNGITGVTLKNGDGCTCHNATPTAAVSVVISGPDTLQPNTTGTYMVTISGGPLTRGGTDIAASAGTLTALAGDLRNENGELTHTSPKAPSGGTVTFQFTYTAPASTGSQTLYANGNSVNFNGNNTGDQWNFASNKTVVVVEGPNGINEGTNVLSYSLEQNYPNPFNPSTKIHYSIPFAGNISLTVYDVTGKEIAVLAEGYKAAGNYEAEFNARSFASGIYFYKLSTGSYSAIKKMMLLK